MIIGIDMGHTISGANYGAVGIKKESEETRKVGKLVIQYLKDLGHSVVDCTVDKASSNSDSLSGRVNKANAKKLDLFVSIHFNASNGAGHGVEIYTYKAKQLDVAKRVLSNISSLGFRNRGIKDGSSLYVIKKTKAPAMLIECCFIDNKEDMSRYDSTKMAKVIAEGIANKKIVDKEPEVNSNVLYRVIAGSYNDRANAEKQVTELKNKGYNAFIDIYKK